MEKSDIKKILISIFIGACVAFLQVFFQGVVEFMQTYAQEIISGMVGSMAYLAQKLNRYV